MLCTDSLAALPAFALLAGATVWTLPETKGVRLMSDARERVST